MCTDVRVTNVVFQKYPNLGLMRLMQHLRLHLHNIFASVPQKIDKRSIIL